MHLLVLVFSNSDKIVREATQLQHLLKFREKKSTQAVFKALTKLSVVFSAIWRLLL